MWSRRIALLVALVPAFTSRGSAHDFWIEPSSFDPAPGAAVSFRLAVGQRWQGDAFPRSERRIVRFTLIGPEDARSIPGAEGADPAGGIAVEGPGIYVAAYQSNSGELQLEPERFVEYVRLEGLEWVLVEGRRRGEEGRGRSDGLGRAELRLPAAGVWLVKSVHMVRLEGTEAEWQHAEWQSWWASLTFALPAR